MSAGEARAVCRRQDVELHDMTNGIKGKVALSVVPKSA